MLWDIGGIFDKISEEGMTITETMKEIVGSFLGTVIYSVLIGVLSGRCAWIQLLSVHLSSESLDS